ncbi:NOL1/NOP2/sun family protein [Histomonas meleagridis]|uniref:NOL1/NOP2/sun family protein n=1 Tax=Histomonas meleagridis TaxID=135588 RepID=UPI003559547D|nr:NOL1/NOP2/sun family protein [Histomonas meleagridis]KAH0802322.1 NOL1/NOP2/sun family protein [Histomonas meleagridis]
MPRTKRNKQQQQNKERPDRTEAGVILPEFIEYYKTQLVPNSLTESEFEVFIETYKTTLPHVFRISPSSPDFDQIKQELESHIKTFKDNNYDAEIIDYFEPQHGIVCKISVSKPVLHKIPELQPFREWLNSHTESGDITRQEFVSMLPAFFLNAQPNDGVLDTCAAPGSKTSLILEQLIDGFVVANDSELMRCSTLIRQLKRFDNSKVLVINHFGQQIPDIGPFDRVLCDVPCSGDGTFRKNSDASIRWTDRKGFGNHNQQRSILIRGLQLLKVGGTCVYSTCSLNPIEDEAVINSVLNELNGSVTVINCSEMFPKLKRSQGLKTWKVILNGKVINEDDEIDENEQKRIKPTMYPKNVIEGIENCIRFYPHQNDTGGFFIAVLKKEKEFEIDPHQIQTKSLKQWKNPPFVSLDSFEAGKEIIPKIIESFGMTNDFDSTKLFTRSEQMNNIFYVRDDIAKIIKKIPYTKLRAVSCGSRMFSIKTFKDKTAVTTFPCFESINLLFKFATKRILELSPEDIYKILKGGNDGAKISDLKSFEDNGITSGGIMMTIKGTNFKYTAMKTNTNIIVQVNKERVQQEIVRILYKYPQLNNE